MGHGTSQYTQVGGWGLMWPWLPLLHVNLISVLASLYKRSVSKQRSPHPALYLHPKTNYLAHLLLARGRFSAPPNASLTLMCSCSWASCCRESCSCCRWNSAMRICLWICCFCFSASSSCCSCCSRSVGSVTGMGNWWSKRRSIGTEVGATCKGSAVVTSTARWKHNSRG